MLKLENTKNCLGIRAIGIYDDFHELYIAINRLSELHFKVIAGYIQRDTRLKNNQERKAILHNYDEIHKCILSFCHDMKCAYTNNKGLEYVNQNTTIYYTFNFLYPWAIYYILNFGIILEDDFDKEEFKVMDNPYNMIEYRKDRGIIDAFSMKVWNCIMDLIGKKQVLNYYDLVQEYSENISVEWQYIDSYCYYYCDQKKKGKKLHKDMITALCYELILDNSVKNNNDYKQAVKHIENMTHKDYLTYKHFRDDMRALFTWIGPFGQSDFDKIKESYGHVDWNHIEL